MNGSKRYCELIERNNTTAKRALRKLIESGFVERNQRNNYFIRGYPLMQGNTIEVNQKFLPFYLSDGWRFFAQITEYLVMVVYNPPPQIPIAGRDFELDSSSLTRGQQINVLKDDLLLGHFDPKVWKLIANLGNSLVLEFDPPLAIPSAN
jgi:hypothetical protein